MFQRISEGGFPRVTGDFRRGFDSGPRVGRTLGNEPTHRTALDRPTGDELPAATGGPAAAVRVQPVGGIRGCKRRRASVPRSNLPADRFGKDLGPWGGSDFAIAVVRDGAARRTREPGRSEGDQPGADREGRSHRFTPAGGAGYRQYRDSSLWSAGEQRIQRTFRVHLLSPAAAVQSGGRLPGGETATR